MYKLMMTIKKFRTASQSYGRGMDNYRQSAKYDICKDGVLVGKLWARQQQYMDRSTWEILRFEGEALRPLTTIWRGVKKAAVQWINDHPNSF
jgi:hypothetical protein